MECRIARPKLPHHFFGVSNILKQIRRPKLAYIRRRRSLIMTFITDWSSSECMDSCGTTWIISRFIVGCSRALLMLLAYETEQLALSISMNLQIYDSSFIFPLMTLTSVGRTKDLKFIDYVGFQAFQCWWPRERIWSSEQEWSMIAWAFKNSHSVWHVAVSKHQHLDFGIQLKR